MDNSVCNDCGGKMETGIIVGIPNVSRPSDKYFWLEGVDSDLDWTLRIKAEKRTKHPLYALRCTQCGLLKFYANSDNEEAKE